MIQLAYLKKNRIFLPLLFIIFYLVYDFLFYLLYLLSDIKSEPFSALLQILCQLQSGSLLPLKSQSQLPSIYYSNNLEKVVLSKLKYTQQAPVIILTEVKDRSSFDISNFITGILIWNVTIFASNVRTILMLLDP